MPAVLARTRPFSRRQVFAGSAALGTLWISGCAAGPDDRGSAPGRTVESARGPVTVPQDPVRVVTVGYNSAFQMQAISARPIAVIDYSQSIADLNPEQLAFVRGLPTVGAYRSVDVEAIAAQRPDLIVGEDDDVDDGLYRMLSSVAPTYLSAPNDRADWRTAAEGVAAALGRGAALSDGRRELDGLTADLSRRYADVLSRERFALISFGDGTGTYSITYPDSAQGGLVASVGGRFSANSQKLGMRSSYESFPFEALGRLEDATTILYPLNGSGETYPRIDQILASPLWQRLPAALAGRVRPIVGLYAVTDYPTATAALREFDRVVLSTL